MSGLGLEPAAALEEDQEHDERGEFKADAKPEERSGTGNVPDLVAEVLAEEARDPAERQEDGRDHSQLLHHAVQSVRDGR